MRPDTSEPSEKPINSQGAARRSIVIGASTGGVEALYTVLSRFPEDCPPTFVVQHMRPGYVESFVAGLNKACSANVVLAQDRQIPRAGCIYVAPAGASHMNLTAHPVLTMRLINGPAVHGHRPAVEPLFLSAARLRPPPVAALLTGMGRDGAEGLLAIRRAGGHTIAQDEASSVVYGMPGSARELNAADQILPLSFIAAALLRMATQPSTNGSGR
ncbi:CheB methylesterase domain-containing protein [Pseudotabrizicola sp.]|uniref:CheB methylesterase domain-containing protein n=1 Tax=Pseudotabrizicola sp. TaxID=2939647 RepID=UPI002715D836|nr:CheB methylesterase domain-containing protein [Pseudotabrizicola sp.]MDO8881871.1 CheB methylesterase domain-containing protein [Pseudotabrizicola sp.]